MEGYHIMKASILDNMGMSDDAVAAYRRIIDLNPDSYLAHLNLGITLMRQNSFENAYSEIMRAHEIAPQSPSPFLLLSRIAGIRGESYEEERFLQEFVKVGKMIPDCRRLRNGFSP
jgi:tetratricopeptide (TPR) repeat protein